MVLKGIFYFKIKFNQKKLKIIPKLVDLPFLICYSVCVDKGEKNMKSSQFGKELRKLMIEHDENLIVLSQLLDVSIPFVSAVISGTKNVPTGWVEAISTHYNLDLQKQTHLKNLAEESKQMLKINLTNCTNSQRGLALQLQRNLSNLNESEIEKLMKILGEIE